MIPIAGISSFDWLRCRCRHGLAPAQQQALFENTARAMGDAPIEIKRRHVANCTKCDPAYGAGVAKALGIEG